MRSSTTHTRKKEDNHGSENTLGSQGIQAITVLSSDEAPEETDTIFFHARAWGDDDGLFDLAKQLYHTNRAKTVSINGGCGGPPGNTVMGENWPGWEHYQSELKKLGIGVICATNTALNTKEENEAFLKFAIYKRWRSAIILGQPHQLLRAFLGIIASMRDHLYWMRIYAAAPKATDWTKELHGAYNVPPAPRFNHILQELERVALYQAKGDLASFNELFTYLGMRSLAR
ncbi:MAG: hypothetical protein U1A25_01390 [Candidatus Sungbacteria bacterium]|nr:hypothetical protein [bacterium]MDZ4260294.1 hypothetical protein [Candidatus Sungbacteria bacterium]